MIKFILIMAMIIPSLVFADLRYNPYSETFETTQPGDILINVPQSNYWTYDPPGSVARFNPYNETWELYQTQNPYCRPERDTHAMGINPFNLKPGQIKIPGR